MTKHVHSSLLGTQTPLEPEGTRESIFPNPTISHSCCFGVKERAVASSEPPDSMPSRPHCPTWRSEEAFQRCLLVPLVSVLSAAGLCWAALSDLSPEPGSTAGVGNVLPLSPRPPRLRRPSLQCGSGQVGS